MYQATLATKTNVNSTLSRTGLEQEILDSINTELEYRVVATRALVNYSEALAAITSAGRDGRESAANVGEAFNSLLTTLSVGALPTKYVDLATNLYGLVAQAKAAKSFSKAIQQADPAVRQMASILIADFQDSH